MISGKGPTYTHEATAEMLGRRDRSYHIGALAKLFSPFRLNVMRIHLIAHQTVPFPLVSTMSAILQTFKAMNSYDEETNSHIRV